MLFGINCSGVGFYEEMRAGRGKAEKAETPMPGLGEEALILVFAQDLGSPSDLYFALDPLFRFDIVLLRYIVSVPFYHFSYFAEDFVNFSHAMYLRQLDRKSTRLNSSHVK